MPKRYREMGADARALATYVKLLRASESAMREAGRPLALYGLTPIEFGVLESLEDAGPRRLADLAQRIVEASGDLAVVVENLAKRGLVRRRIGGRNRRSGKVVLTRKGRTLVRSIFPGHAAAIVGLMSRLTGSEQAALGELCRKLTYSQATSKSSG